MIQQLLKSQKLHSFTDTLFRRTPSPGIAKTETDILSSCHVREETRSLKHIAKRSLPCRNENLLFIVLPDLVPNDNPALGMLKTRNRSEDRGLSASGGPEKHSNAGLVQLKFNIEEKSFPRFRCSRMLPPVLFSSLMPWTSRSGDSESKARRAR